MRTTIELPDDVRRQLLEEAAARNCKGFSTIVVEALRRYLGTDRTDRSARVTELKGCLSDKELKEARKRFAEGRGQWRT